MWTKDLINFIPIYCHHWDCGLGPVQVRQAWEYLRGWNVLVGGRLQLGLRFWFPPDPRRRCCSLFLNLNWWKGYCYHKILIMVPRVGDGDPSFPVHPCSSDVCDVENIITWHCVEPKTFSVDQYLSICSLCVIKISIISKIILFYYKRHYFNPWSVCVKSCDTLTQWIIVR